MYKFSRAQNMYKFGKAMDFILNANSTNFGHKILLLLEQTGFFNSKRCDCPPLN